MEPLTKPGESHAAEATTNPWGVRWFQIALGGMVLLLAGAAIGTWLGLEQSGATNGQSLTLEPPVRIATPPPEHLSAEKVADAAWASDQDYLLLIESLDFQEEVDPRPKAPDTPEAVEIVPEPGIGESLESEGAAEAVVEPVLASLPREPDLAPGPESEPLPAWRRYASLRDTPATAPMIALVIDDLGFTERQVTRSMALDPAVTLSFLPYTPGAPRLAAIARAAGFELLVHLPMEPMDPDADPGPDALLLGLSDGEFTRRIERNLSRFSGYVGVNNHMGSAYTRHEAPMREVMRELRARGLLFVDSVTSPAAIGWRVADDFGVPHASRDVFIDTEDDPAFIESQLAILESLARQRGAAIGIGHPHPTTFAVLERWLPRARERGLTLVPISKVVARACGC